MSLITAMPSSEREALIEENLQALSQLRELVAELAPEHYRRPFGAQGRHSLGKHVRHIIDHYDALMAGAGVGRLDYEARERDARLEDEPTLAAERLAELRADLVRIAEPVSTPLSLGYPTEGASVSLTLSTSLARELAFLTSHTVHHMAIIGLLAEQLDIALPEDFGVHPSTLRHWERKARQGQAAQA
ncbi:hypothetical protein HOP52_10255 [Halomonas campisalis]|uniref:DinB-like domain-containing protein n=1 Tax=Billgrantia campisalis TaxID=74661 RepID=A0ABS9P919_9GAMM|nr:DinB family protein [Halomonas campisalis]MCG6658136.1 hypothetical protein [Halomonas campisalis]MDR5862804.1 DinB family protein [Halomonas campisalis]